ncbi:UDP-N-acetylmuramoyl-L-alanyl-D-glutamate--2,6-diaminopimelate ligase [Lentilactobacillus laojiaonis]|uniref:UDP-N-acetylmuramoyl-L-alanyl-D-glutamate--2, 6-diaminopimelate ligase n=1 Tax=Lentilactobacillus laojiaonis TaxID=2883998 RepID=UPI001D0A4B7E|nr:UDP-N-acetylmuramoyl-L-alanyl-D-glutamate--2,6-diaminopimelate ligase [Lentilactobacillus laojiaonis]UDM32561.1 UDP-N-acetylmuramoyl-L-alanyl-D-glutamate--2,6-diaminopimelate ligase [Lentilactobacillus laojiaonis]
MPRINVESILELLNEHDLLVDNEFENNSDSFTGITYNSKNVSKNDLFFCKGNFKESYLIDAIKLGALGYISEVKYKNATIPGIIVKNVQKTMSLISAAFFGFPENNLKIIAYTGTKGKTTSAYFTKSILENTSKDHTALFSTINTVVGPKPEDATKSSLTTPESLDLFTNMYKSVNNKMSKLVMEVSSQAYKKDRVYNLKYDIGVFLNISPDHIGKNEHPTFADYLHCKEQLLVNSKVCVINAETDYLKDVYGAAKATSPLDDVYLYARKGYQNSEDLPVDIQFESLVDNLNESQIKISAVTEKGKALNIDGIYDINLPGDYNESNAVAAAITSALSGSTTEDIEAGLSSTIVPGRMESYTVKNHANVYVDYAHNYASMHSLLEYLSNQTKHDGKIIVVTGSAGDKGEDRREGLGKAISEFGDQAVLTMDDPATEDPKDIAQQIADNISENVRVSYIEDRKTAIINTIKNSNPEDIVIIAGKGHDPYQKINSQDVPYESDSVIVQQVVKGL